jgi:hypothetical protein
LRYDFGVTTRPALSRESSSQPGTRATPARSVLPPHPGPEITPANLPGLQRSAGNAAVVRALERSGRISTAQLAANLQQGREALPATPKPGDPLRFRLPTGAAMKGMMAAARIPEDKLKAAIGRALERMAKEKALLTTDPVADILARIFPSPGTFDEAEFEKVVDVKDRSRIYQSVADAESKISPGDKPNLTAAMDDAAALIDQVVPDKTGLKEVFGSKADLARDVYKIAKTMLGKLKTDLDKLVDTDYNRDDEQVGLGGWAMYSNKRVHLRRTVAEVRDKKGSMITLIHEACHLANNSVNDRGYYGSDGFEAMAEDEKVGNSAHYEELPRRLLGTSKYPGLTFTPGKTAKGGAVTFEDEVRRGASEYLRKAWDKSVDVHQFLRGIRKEIEAGDFKTFNAKKARILEISRLEHLTIHEQSPPATIQLVDIILSEGVARATQRIQIEMKGQSVPAAPAIGKTRKDYVEELVAAATAAYGQLTGNAADDKKLLDWLVKEYKNGL